MQPFCSTGEWNSVIGMADHEWLWLLSITARQHMSNITGDKLLNKQNKISQNQAIALK